MKKNKKIIRNIIIIAITIYVCYTLLSQQQVLNENTKTAEELYETLEEKQAYNTELKNQKDNINSLEFIEQTAREELDMYYPNEKIYIDTGK